MARTVLVRVARNCVRSRVKAALNVWKEGVERAKAEDAKRIVLGRFVQKMRGGVKRKAFEGWEAATRRAIGNRRLAQRYVLRAQRRTAALAFAKWMELVTRRREARKILSKVSSLVKRVCERQIFARLCRAHELASAREKRVKRILTFARRMRNALAARAFATFAAHVEERQRLRRLYTRAAQRLRSNKLLHVVSRWSERAKERVSARRVLTRLFHSMKKAYMASGMSRLRQKVAKENRREALELRSRRCVLRLEHKRVAAAFAAWGGTVREQKRSLRLVRRAALHMKRRLVSKAFARLSESASSRRAARRTIIRAGRVVMKSALASPFWSWRELTEVEAYHERLLSRAISRLGRMKLAASYDTWVDFCALRRRNRGLVTRARARMGRRMAARTFATWVAYSDDRRRF